MSLWSRIAGLVTLSKVTSTTAPANARGTAQVSANGVPDSIDRMQPYGFLSRPVGGIAVQVAIGSNREDLMTICIEDKRYNIALEAGDVCVTDNRGNKVHLSDSGIVVHADHVVVDSPDVKLGDGSGGYLPVVRQGDAATFALTAGPYAVEGTITASATTTEVQAS